MLIVLPNVWSGDGRKASAVTTRSWSKEQTRVAETLTDVDPGCTRGRIGPSRELYQELRAASGTNADSEA
jgi:hypothetical protein